MTRIGFIGLGNMGGPMAANLARAGHTVQVFDLVADSLTRAIEAGCIAAGDAREAVSGCELVISMLPAGEHVRSLWLGESAGERGGQDLLAALPLGALVIDCSTIDVASARQVSMPPSRGAWPARRRARSPSSSVANKRILRRPNPCSPAWGRTCFTPGRSAPAR